jgi:hypothetical protein
MLAAARLRAISMSRAGDLYERLVAGSITMLIALQSSVCAQENLQAMSDDELAEYFMVKERAADLHNSRMVKSCGIFSCSWEYKK